MHVTFVTPAFRHPERTDSPGIRRYSSDLVKALDEKGVAIRVVTFAEDGEPGSLPGRVEVVGLKLSRSLGRRTGNIAQARVLAFGKRFAQSSDLLKNTDIVHADVPLLPIDGVRAWCPVVATSHHVEEIRSLGDLAGVPFGNSYGAYTYRRADAVVTPSESTASRLTRRFNVNRRKVHVIHHGVDLSRFYPDKPAADDLPVPSSRTILFVGPMNHRKNVLILLAAFGQLVHTHPDTKLVLVGTGPLDPQVNRLVRKQGLQGKVLRLAHIDDSHLRRLYSAADIYASPSADEGFGFSVVEAMACRTAVVVLDTAVSREIVGDAGALVPNETCQAWSAGMGSVLDDGQLARSLAGRGFRRVKERYAWGVAAGRYVQLFQDIGQARLRRD